MLSYDQYFGGIMSYWVWDPSLDLGIQMVDSQHHHIMNFINELDSACTSQDQFLVSKTIIGLLDYTITHFAFEEKLMAMAAYPLSADHKVIHDRFATHIDNYKKQHDAGMDVTTALMAELKDWLIHHIKSEDKNYVPYVKHKLNGGGGLKF